MQMCTPSGSQKSVDISTELQGEFQSFGLVCTYIGPYIETHSKIFYCCQCKQSKQQLRVSCVVKTHGLNFFFFSEDFVVLEPDLFNCLKTCLLGDFEM